MGGLGWGVGGTGVGWLGLGGGGSGPGSNFLVDDFGLGSRKFLVGSFNSWGHGEHCRKKGHLQNGRMTLA